MFKASESVKHTPVKTESNPADLAACSGSGTKSLALNESNHLKFLL